VAQLADGARLKDYPARFRRLALTTLKPLARSTEEMLDVAHEAVRSDEHWTVKSPRDFTKAVQAMILAAMERMPPPRPGRRQV